MKFESFDMPENKRILVTDRKIAVPVITVNRNNFSLLRILNGAVLEGTSPRNLVAYSLEPSKGLDFDSAWQFGGFIYQICGSQGVSLAVVKPEVIREIGHKGYTEADKLHQFTHYENNEMFERAVGL